MENCDNCKQPPHKCMDCFKWSNWIKKSCDKCSHNTGDKQRCEWTYGCVKNSYWKPKEKDMERGCENCGQEKCGESYCAGEYSDYKNWTPKEKDMDIIQISEEQATKMAGNITLECDAVNAFDMGIMVSRTIEGWKEKGYIKEELKKCGWCSSEAKINRDKKITCSNDDCIMNGLYFNFIEWDKRS